VSLPAHLVEDAKQMGINLSRAGQAGIEPALKAERDRRWKIENKAAIELFYRGSKNMTATGEVPAVLSQFSVYSMPVAARFCRGRASTTSDPRIPLLRRQDAPPVPINPILSIDGAQDVLMAQNMAAIPVRQLGPQIGALAAERDHIVRAIDALMGGL
jgi:hypothetical protein